jgi:mevalonate kinase
LKSIASAPGKIILFGEHFVVFGIKAILCAIDKRVKVTSNTTEGDSIEVKSNLGNISIPKSKSINEIKSPLLPFIHLSKKMIDRFDHPGGISVTIESSIPSGIGLGSSSACCVAGAASISGLFNNFSKDEIVNLAIEAEKTIFKDTSGADCTVCTYGGIMEYDKENGFKKIEPSLNFPLVIVNSGIPHSTNKVVKKVNEFKKKNELIFSSLCEKEKELVDKVILSLKNNDLTSLGKIMTQNQENLEKLGVSNHALRNMIEIANKTSFGSKITGAGLGGCIISCVDESNLNSTLKNLQSNNYDCFPVKIDSKGLDTF